ncbi:hypothetical protein PLICRDRAFT_56289 [Plicaturopsis crispa FD-325 SS-3]|nr:hypothetical protein PLICRDRAFT_56289 [Plicaturopsis crispa FD-325 SS-3]
MVSAFELDNLQENVIYIPYDPPTESREEATPTLQAYAPYQSRDLPDGVQLRLKAYKDAWACLHAVQATIHALHAPIVEDVVRQVRATYTHEDVLHGLPYYELPVIALSGGNTNCLADVATSLDPSTETDPDESTGAYVSHLYPGECTTVTTGMKALISSFVDNPVNGVDIIKRRPAASTANYDITLLRAWYEAVRDAAADTSDPPRLVIIFHEFEQFDPFVLQDILYICSLHIPFIRLVFIFSLSTPASTSNSTSYLHSTFPRSILSLLRVRNVGVPSGSAVLDAIIEKLFFDPDFIYEPPIMFGPAILSFLDDHFSRHNTSVDGVISILQLAYMKHFDEPLAVLAADSLLGTPSIGAAIQKLQDPSSTPFLESLVARLQLPSPDAQDVIAAVDDARAQFRSKARRSAVAFQVMRRVQAFMRAQGYKTASGETDGGIVSMWCTATRGRMARTAKWLGTMVRKLPEEQLGSLVEDLHQFFSSLPSQIRREREGVYKKINQFLREPDRDDVGDWLAKYLDTDMVDLADGELWDVWYTGMTPFPSELINPSVRASVVAGLLRPFEFTDPPTKQSPDLWELPDTSILFRRYLDSGKMINVYDWFESFALVLEEQKRRAETSGKRRRGGDRKGKGKQREDVEQDVSEDDEEERKLEVQARFIRALHELDHLGFIKHTGRKADHVVRTVFDIPD